MSTVPRSVCPVCLRPVAAHHETVGDATFLVKQCPDHGAFRVIVWRGQPGFHQWKRPKVPSMPRQPLTTVDQGCPLDCGLCDAHGQHTCTAVMEVTWRCNLGCPVCFASSDRTAPPDPTQEEVGRLFDGVRAASGFCNVQLSGGEPTVRDDLFDLIRIGKAKGFPFIQLNTNGLRIAREPDYAAGLAEAGLDSVFLQFDGTDDIIHASLRGQALLESKLVAIDALAAVGIGVVLVPTVVPGVNDHDLGAIIRLAAELSPGVRGVHFQPVSYFGRYPEPPADEQRVTLPELMRHLEDQTDGAIKAQDFQPPGCEHSHCSFHANYMMTESGSLQKLSAGTDCGCLPRPASEGADKAKSFVKRQWSAPQTRLPMADAPDALDRFIERAGTHTLAVSAMAFQDAWTLDIERLKGCCIHTVSPDGRLVPFCAYNLTSMDGETLYRNKAHGTSTS